MAENANINMLGRKVFFLYPQALMQNQIIPELSQDEFEVYCIKDEAKLKRLLKKYPDSIVFANVSEGMKEAEWETWIKSVITDNALTAVDIGVIAAAEDAKIREKYTGQLKVTCGCTVLKAEPAAAQKQLTDILNSVNAKGRRKYVRALTEKEPNITVNFPINGSFVNGVIKDISAVGFSCTFAEDPKMAKNSLFPDIQIRLHSQLLKAEGIVFGSRDDGTEKTYVIVLTQRTSPEVRVRIRKFIQSFLQSKMDGQHL